VKGTLSSKGVSAHTVKTPAEVPEWVKDLNRNTSCDQLVAVGIIRFGRGA
jgi:hypothetical protein